MSAKCELDKMQLMVSEEKLESESQSETEEKKSCGGSSQAENISEDLKEPLKKKRRSKAENLQYESKQEKGRKSYKGKNSQCSICGKIVKGIQMHMLIHQVNSGST